MVGGEAAGVDLGHAVRRETALQDTSQPNSSLAQKISCNTVLRDMVVSVGTRSPKVTKDDRQLRWRCRETQRGLIPDLIWSDGVACRRPSGDWVKRTIVHVPGTRRFMLSWAWAVDFFPLRAMSHTWEGRSVDSYLVTTRCNVVETEPQAGAFSQSPGRLRGSDSRWGQPCVPEARLESDQSSVRRRPWAHVGGQ